MMASLIVEFGVLSAIKFSTKNTFSILIYADLGYTSKSNILNARKLLLTKMNNSQISWKCYLTINIPCIKTFKRNELSLISWSLIYMKYELLKRKIQKKTHNYYQFNLWTLLQTLPFPEDNNGREVGLR